MDVKQVLKMGALVAGITLGVAAGYRFATDSELMLRFSSVAQGVFERSKHRVNGMSEEVAVHTAQVTRNPKFTQEWVRAQWDAIGY